MPWRHQIDSDYDNSRSKIAFSAREPNEGSWTDRLTISRLGSLEAIVPTVVLTSSILISTYLYRTYLRRIPNVDAIRADLVGGKTILGRVTSVGDGDNFRVFHTPGGRLAGWGWLPGRRIPQKRELKDQTVRWARNYY
jgi:hypothetical protein